MNDLDSRQVAEFAPHQFHQLIILLDQNHAPGSFGYQVFSQGTHAGADFDHGVFRSDIQLVHDPCGYRTVGHEILPHAVAGVDVAFFHDAARGIPFRRAGSVF